MTISTALRVFGWLCIAALFVVTIGPISARPVTSTSADFERFIAFLVIGSLFGAAYPRRTLGVLIFLVATAAALEYLQHFVANRHGTLHDFTVKAAAGAIGVGLGRIAWRFM